MSAEVTQKSSVSRRIFDYIDYKQYVVDSLKDFPKQGYGQWRRIAQHLKVHTTLISQIFGGPKELTLEQAVSLCQFLGLGTLETEYLTSLVEFQRAGSKELKALIKRRLQNMQELAGELISRLQQDRVLSESEKATFYSSWYYSGIRLSTSLPGHGSIDAIATRLGLPQPLVRQVIQFLVSTGLVVADGAEFSMGPRHIHLEASSPYVAGHHRNWRSKAMSRLDTLRKDELAFSAPMSLSHADAVAVKAALVATIERVCGIAERSPAEKLACLNIDWFEV